MSTPSNRRQAPTTPAIDVTEEGILQHILFWKHIPTGINFKDRSLQEILDAYDPELDFAELPSRLVPGTPAHARSINLVKEVIARPTIVVDKDNIVEMFNWLRFNEHMSGIHKEADSFSNKIQKTLEFKPIDKEVKKDLTLFEQLQEFREAESQPEKAVELFDLGLEGLNNTTEFAAGNFMIIAARPGSGKTTLSMFFGLANALAGKKVMFMSFEMSKRQILKRMNNFMTARNISIEEQQKLHFTIKYKAPSDLSTFKTYIKNVVTEEKPDILIIDYVQLLTDQNSRNRFDVIANASKFFKNFAMEQDLALITCSQVARNTETFGVSMSSLYGSSELEADADLILAIERGNGGNGGEILHPALIKILKNRDEDMKDIPVLVNYASMNIIEADDETILFDD